MESDCFDTGYVISIHNYSFRFVSFRFVSFRFVSQNTVSLFEIHVSVKIKPANHANTPVAPSYLVIWRDRN